MAIVSKQQLYQLWDKFQSNPRDLNVNEYKTIQDTAQTLFKNGEISKDEAQKMMSEVRNYY